MLAREWREEEFYIEEEAAVDAARPSERYPHPAARPHINAHLRSRAAILALVVTVAASVITVRSGLSATRGYELVQMQRAAAQLERENQQLELDIAHLKAPQRIRDIETNDLGMIVPKDVYFAAGKQ